MKNLINELNRMSFDDATISMEEGYLLVHNSLKYFYHSGRYSFLTQNFSFEDLLDDIFETCIRRELFKRFVLSEDFISGKTQNNGKKAYVKLSVQRMLLDMNNYRRTKVTISADANIEGDEENENLYNTLMDNSINISEEVTTRLDVQGILDGLDDSKGNAEGYSPILGFSKLNHKTAMLHILEGYTVTEISNIYKNPSTGKNVAKTYVSRLLKESRKYFE